MLGFGGRLLGRLVGVLVFLVFVVLLFLFLARDGVGHLSGGVGGRFFARFGFTAGINGCFKY